MVKVSDIMRTDLVSVDYSTSAMQVASLMMENKVSSVVIKKDEEVVGIITDKDFVRMTMLDGNPRGVASHMSTELVTIPLDAGLRDALNLMKEKEVRHLLVKDGEKIIGMVSSKDICRGLANMPPE